MTLLRTLGFTAIMTLLATIVIAPSFMESALFISFILVLLAGFALAHFFSHGSGEEQVEMTSIIFITVSTFNIIIGTLTNILRAITEAFASVPNASASTAALLQLFGKRIIILELLVLLIGLFGPLLILGQLNKQKLPIRQISLNIIAIALLYLLSVAIVTLINARLTHLLL